MKMGYNRNFWMNSRKEMQNWDREKKGEKKQNPQPKPNEAYSLLPTLHAWEKNSGEVYIPRTITAEY